ncbi:MAG: serine/threonine protein kinase [Myxococcales bacterium]|nr:serine/threonine protein kinase [Myxococcales bacterium]
MDGARKGTINNDLLPLLVANLPTAQDVERVARAALDHATIPLPVDEAPDPGVKYAVELTAPGLKRPVTVLGELAGRARGEHLMALRPYGAQGAEDLQVLLGERISEIELDPIEDDPFVGRLLGGGKYEIQAAISSGSAGAVYRGRHLLLDRPIAIKVLHADLAHDPTFTAHFNGEARAASRLDHPNICQIFDFGEDDDGLLYIVMELLEGPELGDVVANEGAMPLARITSLMSQVCAALSVAHDRGIVHRDVKAENILVIKTVDDDGEPAEAVKVCDFGLAMSTDLRGEQFATHRGACGTPAYMPPEQVRGEPLDSRADVYACGVLLYLLATACLPFWDEDPRRICSMQLASTPVPPSQLNPEVDPRLEAVILRAMSKDREQRFANARELRNALRALRTSVPPPARASVPPPAPDPFEDAPISRRRSEWMVESRSDWRRAPDGTVFPLRDPQSGLPTVIDLLLATLTRDIPTEGLAVAFGLLLSGRGQLTFLRGDPSRPELYVHDSTTEPVALTEVSPGPAAAELGKLLTTKTVIALSLREGLDGPQIDALVKRLRGLRPSSASLPHATLITDHARLGRHRSLSWLVDLHATQVAFVLAMTEVPATSRQKALVAALRSLASASDARALLESSDLIGAACKISAWDVACAIGGALAQPVCARLLATLAGELLNQTGNVPIDLVRMLARRLSADRSRQSDDLLRNLFAKSLIGPDEVPESLRSERRADQRALTILEAPERGLAPLEMANTEVSYASEVAVLEEAMRILLKQGRLVAFSQCFRALATHAAMTMHPFRGRLARQALGTFEDAAFLERLALVLLRGPQASHEAAQLVLTTMGLAAANALCKVRLQLGAGLDLGGRKRFMAALKEVGRTGMPAIARTLRQAAVDGEANTTVIEDLLRALPDGGSEEVSALAQTLTSHVAAPIRRAALGALVATDGLRARPRLAAALADSDEGVQLSALIGIQRVGGLELPGVARIEALLSSGSEEIRIAAAQALQGVSLAARAEAITVLSRVLGGKGLSRLFRVTSDDNESVPVLESAARALLRIGGDEGRRTVEQRAERAHGELKRRLLVLLNGPR